MKESPSNSNAEISVLNLRYEVQSDESVSHYFPAATNSKKYQSSVMIAVLFANNRIRNFPIT
jgi:hypothetical protein